MVQHVQLIYKLYMYQLYGFNNQRISSFDHLKFGVTAFHVVFRCGDSTEQSSGFLGHLRAIGGTPFGWLDTSFLFTGTT